MSSDSAGPEPSEANHAPPAPALTHLLDTDHIDFLFEGEGSEFDALNQRLSGEVDGSVVFFALCVVSFEEQLRGALKLISGDSRPRARRNTLHGYSLLVDYAGAYGTTPLLPFDAPAAAEFSRLRREVTPQKVKTMDLRIAAVALANDLTLLTRNATDFGRVPGLRFEDWTAPAAE